MKQIIFDLDDTLYDNSLLRKKREEAILEFLGDKKEDYLELKKGYGTMESLSMLGFTKKDFFKLMNSVPIDLEKDLGLIALFEKIKKDFKIIILSNSSDLCIKESLKKLGIFDFIDVYYSSEHFENFKPCIECFFMVQKGDICIGNNFKKDLEIPKKLGAITILIGNSNDISADYNLENIYQLENIIEKLKDADN